MIKKFKNLIVLALACVLAAAGVAGCSSTHEHDVSKWVTITEATCTTTGVEEGICATCGETIYRDIPIDENNHNYGEWKITSTPTSSRRGTATKTCLDCGETLLVSLPTLDSDDEYTSSITTRPTATTDGERTYTYAHEEGDITFTTKISSTGITSVRDAVDVSTDSISHALVRSGTGTIYNATYSSGPTPSSSSTYDYFYEYGENYTHIDDRASDNRQRWYGIDEDGNIYGYCKYGSDDVYEETKTTAGSEDYYYGYRYTFYPATWVGTFYGTENLLAGLYTAARVNVNNDFAEDSYSSGGTMVYSFSYGRYYNFGTSSGHFAQVEVTFSLTSEYTIKTLTAKCTTYVNDTSEGYATWELGENGYAKVTNPTGPRYVATYTLEQVTKTEDADEPENPYDESKTRITGFDVIYNPNINKDGSYNGDGTTVTDGTLITLTAQTATQTTYNYTYTQYDSAGENPESVTTSGTVNHFYLTNIVPTTLATSVSSDLTAYYRKYNSSGAYTDIEIGSQTATGSTTSSSYVGIAFSFNANNNSFFVNCKISGYVDIVLKTSKYEKVIHLYVEPIAPSTLYAMVYEYSSTGYSWTSDYAAAVTESVYTGQGLYFKTAVPTTESLYTSAEYTAEVTSALDASGAAIDASCYTLLQETTFYSQTMSRFSATVAGTYVITLTSKVDSSKVTTITVTVSDAPDIDSILTGSYSGRFTYSPKGTITVTFEAGGEAGVYYATIEIGNNGTEVLKITYSGTTVTSEHSSGADFGLTLKLNENYELELSHVINDDGDIETETLLQTTS